MLQDDRKLRDETLTQFHAYSLTRMRTVATVVLGLGLLEYVLLMVARGQLPQSLPDVAHYLQIGLIPIFAGLALLMSRVATARGFGIVGVTYASLVELGFLLSAQGLEHAVSWILPAVMLVPLAAGPLWLTRKQYFFGTALCWITSLTMLASMSMTSQELIMIKVYFVMNLTLSTILHIIFYGHRLQNYTLEQSLARQASVDSLTGTLNRGAFLTQSARLIAESSRRGIGSSVLYMDLDRFKIVNDTYGHAAGDELLRKSAAMLSVNMRDGDLFGRLGGEEFAMLIVTATEGEALAMAERLRESVKAIERPDGIMSISIGVARATANETIESLLDRADAAMLSAKRNGRDRVESA